MKNLVFKLEHYHGDVNGTDGIWQELDKALTALKETLSYKGSGFSIIEVWDASTGDYLDEVGYPDIRICKDTGRFYVAVFVSNAEVYGHEPWYFDSAVEYRMRAVGALRDG